MPFGRAMRKLFNDIDQAEKFCQEFKEEFDAEVSGIAKYTTAHIKASLWLLKVDGSSGDTFDSQNSTEDDAFTRKEISERFHKLPENIANSMYNAIHARIGETSELSRNIESRLDSRRNLQRKLEVSNEILRDLLQKTMKGREYCDSLLKELELVKDLTDPRSERNLNLYEYGSTDEGYYEE
jgi:hypothetical protein